MAWFVTPLVSTEKQPVCLAVKPDPVEMISVMVGMTEIVLVMLLPELELQLVWVEWKPVTVEIQLVKVAMRPVIQVAQKSVNLAKLPAWIVYQLVEIQPGVVALQSVTVVRRPVMVAKLLVFVVEASVVAVVVAGTPSVASAAAVVVDSC